MPSSRRLFALLSGLLLAALLFPDSAAADTYTGRRWFVRIPGHTCYFWGYIKKPGQKWTAARLVVIDQRVSVPPPDAAGGKPELIGSDHNFEYTIEGSFTGRSAYDPNADLVLPTFAAKKFTLVNRAPGALPGVGPPENNQVIPVREAGGRTPARLRR